MNSNNYPLITSPEIKILKSLSQKKYRELKNLFLIEGKKLVLEAVTSNQPVQKIFVTQNFIDKNPDYFDDLKFPRNNIFLVHEKDFEKIANTLTPEGIAALLLIVKPEFQVKDFSGEEMILYLDRITDPGNLGTIIRTADWFGVNVILLSSDCVELHNPKTLRASMGSIFHCKIFDQCDRNVLEELHKQNYKIVATALKGKKFSSTYFKQKSVIIFSSESHGLSEELHSIVDEYVTIPKFGKAESLNVSAAAAAILALTKC